MHTGGVIVVTRVFGEAVGISGRLSSPYLAVFAAG